MCLPHLQPSAPPLSPGPTPVHANRTPKHGASRHTRQSPHPRRELAAAIPTTSFYLRVCRHRTLRCWLLPLRLPHPVASHAPGPHDVAKCCQCPSNTTTPPPWIVSPGSHSIRRHLQAGSRGLRQFTQDSSCSAPRYCNHEPIRSSHLEGHESVLEGILTTGTWAVRRKAMYLMRAGAEEPSWAPVQRSPTVERLSERWDKTFLAWLF